MENEAQDAALQQNLDDVFKKVVEARSALQRLEHTLYLTQHSRPVTFQITEDEQEELESFLRGYREA